jgi:hypothetical protein
MVNESQRRATLPMRPRRQSSYLHDCNRLLPSGMNISPLTYPAWIISSTFCMLLLSYSDFSLADVKPKVGSDVSHVFVRTICPTEIHLLNLNMSFLLCLLTAKGRSSLVRGFNRVNMNLTLEECYVNHRCQFFFINGNT